MVSNHLKILVKLDYMLIFARMRETIAPQRNMFGRSLRSFKEARRTYQQNTPPKFNIAPEKWWLEDGVPIGEKGTFQGQAVTLRRCSPFFCGELQELNKNPIFHIGLRQPPTGRKKSKLPNPYHPYLPIFTIIENNH